MCHQALFFFVKSGAHSTEKERVCFTFREISWCILSCKGRNKFFTYVWSRKKKRSELPKHTRQSVQSSAKIKYFRNRRPFASKWQLNYFSEATRTNCGRKSLQNIYSWRCLRCLRWQVPKKIQKGLQSQLLKFANVMLAALLLLHNGFYRYSTIIFQKESELFTVLWKFQMWKKVN